MNVTQSLRMAIKSILSNKIRSVLTMLGIIIGVAAVIVIVGLGNGMQVYMRETFDSMGVNLIGVQTWSPGDTRTVSEEDMYQLAEEHPDLLSMVSPMVSLGGAKVGNEFLSSAQVTGVSEDYAKINRDEVEQGRYLQYVDILRRSNVCVVGSYINDTYFAGDGLGKSVKVMGAPFSIVGVMKQKGDGTEHSPDNSIFMPYTVAGKLAGQGNFGMYYFSAASEDAAIPATNVIRAKLLEIYGDESYFYVQSATEMMDQLNAMMNVTVAILTAIAAISLVVGGIGIMNIMLVSVTERTREIGIRKALGAKRRHIMMQFIIEAGATSAIGGLLGIAMGYGLSAVASAMIAAGLQQEMSVVPTMSSVLTAFGISAGIGIFFGYLPARKAARLNPIDALRYD